MTSNQPLNPLAINNSDFSLKSLFAVTKSSLLSINSDQGNTIQYGFVDYQPQFSVTNVLTNLINAVHNNSTIHNFGARRSARLSVRRRR